MLLSHDCHMFFLVSSSLYNSKYWEDRELAGFSCLTNLSNLTHEDTLTTPELGQMNKEVYMYDIMSLNDYVYVHEYLYAQ